MEETEAILFTKKWTMFKIDESFTVWNMHVSKSLEFDLSLQKWQTTSKYGMVTNLFSMVSFLFLSNVCERSLILWIIPRNKYTFH